MAIITNYVAPLDDSANSDEAPAGGARKPKFERVVSSIVFPYSDITDAIVVAEGLLKGGGMPLSRDQLAAAMNQAPAGGGFNTKVSTARTFGVVETVQGKYQLTEVGFEIADPSRQREAMVKAFLNVDLYRQVYEQFRGKRLPPRPHGLEAALVALGVSQKQATNARLAFDKSARKAGFFPNAEEDRLVMPFTFGQPSDENYQDPEKEKATPVALSAAVMPAAYASGLSLHPSIEGLLSELPLPKSQWSKAEQADWLSALGTIFRVVYKSDDKGEIAVSYTPARSHFD